MAIGQEVDWSLVDMEAQPGAIGERFEAARARGEEGLMLKAAMRAYVPNARTNVLKLKAEFIPGLGDTVTLLVVGARYARRVGRGAGAALVCELACAAPRDADLAAASSTAGPFTSLTWLFNTAALSYKESSGLSSANYEQLLRTLNEEIVTGAPVSAAGDAVLRRPRMRRLRQDEPLPSWLLHAPKGRERRPHFVLTEPALAVKVEVLGSRFLTRFVNDDDAVSLVPWKLRFPRVVRWFGGGVGHQHGAIADTVESYRLKGCDAWLAQRGLSWPSIADELLQSGDLGNDAEDASSLAHAEGAASLALGTGAAAAAGSLALETPRAETPLPMQKRPRTASGDAGQNGGDGARSHEPACELPSTGGISDLVKRSKGFLKVAQNCMQARDVEGALLSYRRAAALFAEEGRGSNRADAAQPGWISSASAADQQDVAGQHDTDGWERIRHAITALSNVAGSLEALSRATQRPMESEQVREALRMRLRAIRVCRDNHAQYANPPPGMQGKRPNLEQLEAKLAAFCEREEVRRLLHGVLVARMERTQQEAALAKEARKEAGNARYIQDDSEGGED